MKLPLIQSYGRLRLSNIVLTVLIAVIVSAICVLSVVPPVSRDALTHHLYVPKMYLKAGGIVELPQIPFSYYPMNLDMLYLFPLWFGNDIVPKYIHFLFALMTAWMIYRYLSQRIDKTYGLFGAFFFLWVPVVVKLSTTVYVDLGLICFVAASVLNIEEWRRKEFRPSKLVVAGIFCGLALGTKYNGLVAFALLTLMVPFLYVRDQAGTIRLQYKAVCNGALFAGIALLVFSPWMIRNLIWTGNPVYPLYQGVYEELMENPHKTNVSYGGGEELTPEVKIKWSPFNIRSIIYGESKWEIAAIPLRIFFQGKDDNPKYFDGVLTPWLILFPLGLLLKGRNEEQNAISGCGFLGAFALIFLLVVFFKQDMRIRYISPVVPALVLLSVAGLNRIASTIGSIWSRIDPFKDALVLGAAVCCILSTSVPYVHATFQNVSPLDYISGRIERDAYISRHRPEYFTIQYANQHLDASNNILGVYLGNRGYYFDNPVTFTSRFIEDFVKPYSKAEDISDEIQSRDIQYLLVNFTLINKRASEGLNAEQQRMLTRFFSDELQPIFSSNGHGLFRLR